MAGQVHVPPLSSAGGGQGTTPDTVSPSSPVRSFAAPPKDTEAISPPKDTEAISPQQGGQQLVTPSRLETPADGGLRPDASPAGTTPLAGQDEHQRAASATASAGADGHQSPGDGGLGSNTSPAGTTPIAEEGEVQSRVVPAVSSADAELPLTASEGREGAVSPEVSASAPGVSRADQVMARLTDQDPSPVAGQDGRLTDPAITRNEHALTVPDTHPDLVTGRDPDPHPQPDPDPNPVSGLVSGRVTGGVSMPGQDRPAWGEVPAAATAARQGVGVLPVLGVPVSDPIRPQQWRARRQAAPASALWTERFDPARDPLRQAPGVLAGRDTVIRMWIRRIQADDGRWVRNLTLHLPVRTGDGFTPDELPAFQAHLRELLDRHVNHGLTLPESHDQLHIDLNLIHTPENPQTSQPNTNTSDTSGQGEAIELSTSNTPATANQFHFRLHSVDPADRSVQAQDLRQVNDAIVLHELLHYLGLPDQYHDESSLFRRTADHSTQASTGIMSDLNTLPGPAIPPHYLHTIEHVLNSGPAVRDHPCTHTTPPANNPQSTPTDHDTLHLPPPHQTPLHPTSQAPPIANTTPQPAKDFTAEEAQPGSSSTVAAPVPALTERGAGRTDTAAAAPRLTEHSAGENSGAAKLSDLARKTSEDVLLTDRAENIPPISGTRPATVSGSRTADMEPAVPNPSPTTPLDPQGQPSTTVNPALADSDVLPTDETPLSLGGGASSLGDPAKAAPAIRSIGVPKAELPYMSQLIDRLRSQAEAAGHSVSDQVWEMLPQRLLSNYRYLVGDPQALSGTWGMQVPLGPLEALISLNPTGPRRVANPSAAITGDQAPPAIPGDDTFHANGTINAVYATGAHAQTQSGQTGATRGGLSAAVGVGLPSTVAQVARVGAGISGTANQSSRTTTRIVDAEAGHVEDDRIDSTLLSYEPNWSFRIRSAPDQPWSETENHQLPDPGTERLLLWVPEHYLSPSQPKPVTAVGVGEKERQLPDTYFASGFTGMPKLFDNIVTKLKGEGLDLPIGSTTRDELLQKLWNLDAHLDEAVNDTRGYMFLLHGPRGRPAAAVAVRTRRHGAERVGETSDKAHLENVRTAIDGFSGGHTVTNTSTITPLLASLDVEPIPGTELGVAPTVHASATWTNHDGLSAGRNALNVVVPRYVGYTAGYEITFEHHAKISVRGKEVAVDTEPVPDRALVRLAEPDAFAHGFAVDRDAFKTAPGPLDFVPFTPDAVRGSGRGPEDPVTKPVPAHVAKGKGIGMGLVTVKQQTVDDLQAWLRKELSARGFLPPNQEHPFGSRAWWQHGTELDSWLDNRTLLAKLVSRRGLESHYDQVHQDGLTFTLRHRQGFAGVTLDVDSARITITASKSKAAPPRFVRSTDEYHTVNLAMGMAISGQSAGGGKKLAAGIKFRGLFEMFRGGTLGVELQRGTSASQFVTYINNRPELLEYPGRVDEFELTSDYRVTVEFQHSGAQGKTRRGLRDPEPFTLRGQSAQALVLPLGTEDGPDSVKPTPPQVLDQGVVYYLDTTGARKAATAALEDLTGPAGAADQELNTFASTIAMRSHLKEILYGAYTSDQPFKAGLFRDTFGAVDIRGAMGPSQYVGATDDKFVLGVIKLWLAQAGTARTTSSGLAWTQVDALLGGGAGSVTVAGGLNASRGWQWNTTSSTVATGGKELIQLDFNRVYAYRTTVAFAFTGRQEKHGKLALASLHGKSKPLSDPDNMTYLLPEPEALHHYAQGTLPVPDSKLADALARWERGELKLPGTTVAGVLTRWMQEVRTLPEAVTVDRHALARTLADLHHIAALPVLDNKARDSFNKVFGRKLDEPAHRRDELTLPEYLTRKDSGGVLLGHSGVHSLTYESGKSTFDIVREQLDEIAPGLLASNPELWTGDGRPKRRIGQLQGSVSALQSLLSQGRDQAMLEDLVSLNGHSFYLVNPVGWLLTDIVEIRLTTKVEPTPKVHDAYAETGLENYGHAYASRSTGTSRDGSQGAGITALAAEDHGAGSGALSAAEGHHRGTTRSDVAVTEQTAYDWTGHYRVEFPQTLTVTTRRLDMAGRPLNNMLTGWYRQQSQLDEEHTVSEPGTLLIQVPRGLAESRPFAGPAPARDVTPLPPLPGDSYVTGVLLDDAVPAGRRLLADMFGAQADSSTMRSSLVLATLLSRSHLTNHLNEATAGKRYQLADNVFIPGHSSDRATLWLRGDLFDFQVIAPVEGTGTGRYTKHQSGTTAGSTTDRRFAAGVTPSANGALIGLPPPPTGGNGDAPVPPLAPPTGGNGDASIPPAPPTKNGNSDATAPPAPPTMNGNNTLNRLASTGQTSAGTENYRREQHVKQQGLVYLVRMRARFSLEAQRFYHHLFRDPSPRGTYRSDPITGDVYAELYAGEVEQLQAQLAGARRRRLAVEQPWHALESAPSFNLGQLLIAAAKGAPSPAHIPLRAADNIRTPTGSLPGAVVLTVDAPAPDQAASPATSGSGGSTDPAKGPAQLPMQIYARALDPVFAARDIASELDIPVRVDMTLKDGTLRRRWIDPAGRVYAFDPLTFDDISLPADAAQRVGLLGDLPELSEALRLDVDAYGIGSVELGTIYRTSWTGGSTFEQALAAEIDRRREARAADPDGLPGAEQEPVQDAPPVARNGLAAVVSFEEGASYVAEAERDRIDRLAREVADQAVCNRRAGLPLPRVEITGYDHGLGERLRRASQAERVARDIGLRRAKATAVDLRAGLAARLDALRQAGQTDLTADQLELGVLRFGGRGADPARAVGSTAASRHRRAELVVDYRVPQLQKGKGARTVSLNDRNAPLARGLRLAESVALHAVTDAGAPGGAGLFGDLASVLATSLTMSGAPGRDAVREAVSDHGLLRDLSRALALGGWVPSSELRSAHDSLRGGYRMRATYVAVAPVRAVSADAAAGREARTLYQARVRVEIEGAGPRTVLMRAGRRQQTAEREMAVLLSLRSSEAAELGLELPAGAAEVEPALGQPGFDRRPPSDAGRADTRLSGVDTASLAERIEKKFLTDPRLAGFLPRFGNANGSASVFGAATEQARQWDNYQKLIEALSPDNLQARRDELLTDGIPVELKRKDWKATETVVVRIKGKLHEDTIAYRGDTGPQPDSATAAEGADRSGSTAKRSLGVFDAQLTLRADITSVKRNRLKFLRRFVQQARVKPVHEQQVAQLDVDPSTVRLTTETAPLTAETAPQLPELELDQGPLWDSDAALAQLADSLASQTPTVSEPSEASDSEADSAQLSPLRGRPSLDSLGLVDPDMGVQASAAFNRLVGQPLADSHPSTSPAVPHEEIPPATASGGSPRPELPANGTEFVTPDDSAEAPVLAERRRTVAEDPDVRLQDGPERSVRIEPGSDWPQGHEQSAEVESWPEGLAAGGGDSSAASGSAGDSAGAAVAESGSAVASRQPTHPVRVADREYGVLEVPGDRGYSTVEELLADLDRTVAVLDVRTLEVHGRLLGIFGLRHPEEPPHFLKKPNGEVFDSTTLDADQAVHYLRLMNMLSDEPQPEGLDPVNWNLAEGVYSYNGLPRLVHAIWLGGPLREHGPSAGFWRTFGSAASNFGNDASFVLWTDVPRGAVETVSGLTKEPGDPGLAGVWHLVRWAKKNDIQLQNVFEHYNSAHPMVLHTEFALEMAKRTGRGWAAASDMLRWTVLSRFGGLYSDGDNKINSLEILHKVTSSTKEFPERFAVHALGSAFGNSAMVMPSRHPLADEVFAYFREQYGRSQLDLYDLEFAHSTNFWFGGAIQRSWRHSVVFRVGPDSVRTALLRHGRGYRHHSDLPRIVGIAFGRDASWMTPASQLPAMTRGETLRFTQDLLETLARNLFHNRPGDLHLTVTADAIAQLSEENQELVWKALTRFMASREDFRARVRGVTVRRKTSEDAEFTVALPAEVRGLLRRDDEGQPPLGDPQGEDGGGWFVLEQCIPARLLEQPHRDGDGGLFRPPVPNTIVAEPDPAVKGRGPGEDRAESPEPADYSFDSFSSDEEDSDDGGADGAAPRYVLVESPEPIDTESVESPESTATEFFGARVGASLHGEDEDFSSAEPVLPSGGSSSVVDILPQSASEAGRAAGAAPRFFERRTYGWGRGEYDPWVRAEAVRFAAELLEPSSQGSVQPAFNAAAFDRAWWKLADNVDLESALAEAKTIVGERLGRLPLSLDGHEPFDAVSTADQVVRRVTHRLYRWRVAHRWAAHRHGPKGSVARSGSDDAGTGAHAGPSQPGLVGGVRLFGSSAAAGSRVDVGRVTPPELRRNDSMQDLIDSGSFETNVAELSVVMSDDQWTVWGTADPDPKMTVLVAENQSLGLLGAFDFAGPRTGGRVSDLGGQLYSSPPAWNWYLLRRNGPVAASLYNSVERADGAVVPVGPPVAHPVSLTPHVDPSVTAADATILRQGLAGGMRWRWPEAEPMDLHKFSRSDPREVFERGLLPKGRDLVHLIEHVYSNPPSTGYISTTRDVDYLTQSVRNDASAADLLYGSYPWRYDVTVPGGIDVNATLGLASPFPDQQEVAFPGGIHRQYIRGVQPLWNGHPYGPYIPSPAYAPPTPPADAASRPLDASESPRGAGIRTQATTSRGGWPVGRLPGVASSAATDGGRLPRTWAEANPWPGQGLLSDAYPRGRVSLPPIYPVSASGRPGQSTVMVTDSHLLPVMRQGSTRSRGFARVYGVVPKGSPPLEVTRTYVPGLSEEALSLGLYNEVQPPWLATGAPLPFFVVAEGGHDHVMVRLLGSYYKRLGIAEFAAIVAQDPALAQARTQTIVLLIPHAGAQSLDLPRAVAARTRCTVWAVTGDLLLTPNGWLTVANAAEDRSLIVLPDHAGTLPAFSWVRSTPEDLPSTMSSHATNQPRRLVTFHGEVVPDSDVNLYPVVGRNGRPIGRVSVTAQDWNESGHHFGKILGYREYRSLDLTDGAMSEARRVPWADSLARPYIWGSHGYPPRREVPGGVMLSDRAGKNLYVGDKQFGHFLRRRRSVENLPPECPVIVHACEFGVTSADGKSPGQEIANILQRTVYAPDRSIISFDKPERAGLFMHFGPNGEPGTWQRFTPEQQTESGLGSVRREQWPRAFSNSGSRRPASAASYRTPLAPAPGSVASNRPFYTGSPASSLQGDPLSRAEPVLEVLQGERRRAPVRMPSPSPSFGSPASAMPMAYPYTPQMGQGSFSTPRQRRLSDLGTGRSSWSPTLAGDWSGARQSLDLDALRDALPPAANASDVEAWGGDWTANRNLPIRGRSGKQWGMAFPDLIEFGPVGVARRLLASPAARQVTHVLEMGGSEPEARDWQAAERASTRNPGDAELTAMERMRGVVRTFHPPRAEAILRPGAVAPGLDGIRPYGRPGGVEPPSAQDQQRLEHVFPRGRDGRFVRFPNPRGSAFRIAGPIRNLNRPDPYRTLATAFGSADWVQRINGRWTQRWGKRVNGLLGGDWGQRTDPEEVDAARRWQWVRDTGRVGNCEDVARSVLESWHGRPTVAARTMLSGLRGVPPTEYEAMSRTERWLGVAYRKHASPGLGWDAAAARLKARGHGSAAIVGFERPSGSFHTINAVNYRGRVYWIDAQRGRVGDQPLYEYNGDFLSIELDPWFRPIDPVPLPQVRDAVSAFSDMPLPWAGSLTPGRVGPSISGPPVTTFDSQPSPAAVGNAPDVPADAAARLHADLEARVGTRPYAGAAPGESGALSRMLGPDYFGLRKAPEPPDFLRGYHFSALHAAQRSAFFDAVDLTLPTPRGKDLRPSALPENRGAVIESTQHTMPRASMPWVPKRVRIPRIVHSIWLGSPLADEGATAAFRRNIESAARQQPDFTFVVWTNIPRQRFEEARSASGTPADTSAQERLRDMLDWAARHRVRLANVDEVFSATAPMELQALYNVEEAKQQGPGYAAASDILRVEIVHRFGGVYTDGDNALTGNLDAEVRRIVDSERTFALAQDTTGRRVNNVIVAPARHVYLDLYRQVFRDNYMRTPYENEARSLILMEEGASLADLRSDLLGVPEIGNHSRIRIANEVGHRTGPSANVFEPLAWMVGLESRTELPAVEPGVLKVNFDNAWLRDGATADQQAAAGSQGGTSAPYEHEATLQTAQRVAGTLVRELHNQPGNLHLALVAPVIGRHSHPDLLWEAVIGFIAGRQELRDMVRWVTRETVDSRGRVISRVELPPRVGKLLKVMESQVPDGARPEDALTAASHVQPARLVSPEEAAITDSAADESPEGGDPQTGETPAVAARLHQQPPPPRQVAVHDQVFQALTRGDALPDPVQPEGQKASYESVRKGPDSLASSAHAATLPRRGYVPGPKSGADSNSGEDAGPDGRGKHSTELPAGHDRTARVGDAREAAVDGNLTGASRQPSTAGQRRTSGQSGEYLGEDIVDPPDALRARPLTTSIYEVLGGDGHSVLFRHPGPIRNETLTLGERQEGAVPSVVVLKQDYEEIRVKDHPVLGISEDRTLALYNGEPGQLVFATRKAVASSNAALAAAGSGVRLRVNEGLSMRIPAPNGGHCELLRVQPEFLTRSGRPEEEVCRDFAQMVSGGGRASHAVFRGPEGSDVDTGPINALASSEVTGIHHLAQALARVADDQHVPREVGPAWAAHQVLRDDRPMGGIGGPAPGESYGNALHHAAFDDQRRGAMSEAARRIGINEHAWAEVGESYLVHSVTAPDDHGVPSLKRNYAKPGEPETSYFGYHFAAVVLSSEDGGHQVTLENFTRRRTMSRQMSTVVQANLRRSPLVSLKQLETTADDKLRRAEDDGLTGDELRKLRGYRALAQALVGAKKAGEDLSAALPGTQEYAEAERVRDLAVKGAAQRMRQASALVEGKERWHFRMFSRRPGETMHEVSAQLLTIAPSDHANPLTTVIVHGHQIPPQQTIRFDEGSHRVGREEMFKIDHVARHLATVGLWNRSQGLPLPQATVTSYGSSRLPNLSGMLPNTSPSRAVTIERVLREGLDRVLHERQRTTAGPRLIAHDFKITTVHVRGTARRREATIEVALTAKRQTETVGVAAGVRLPRTAQTGPGVPTREPGRSGPDAG
ncbi:toxin glutamine deamidase domain-containing protein [Streptomyces sp. NPDC020681]|uniref:scabin-related ADP-ribosyltransferase n=1 Tax=Streptomyces sp. NPDC020681 TaxID=3365083 RepID=UPI0037A8CEB6